MPQIEFETELKMDGETLSILFSGEFEADNDGQITEIRIDTWDGRRFEGQRKTIQPGQMYDLMKATLQADYEDDILDALADDDTAERRADYVYDQRY